MNDTNNDNDFVPLTSFQKRVLARRDLREALNKKANQMIQNFNYLMAAIFFMIAIACVVSNGMIANDNANLWLLFTLLSMSLNNLTKGI